jgi:hypothetical protein
MSAATLMIFFLAQQILLPDALMASLETVRKQFSHNTRIVLLR